VSPRSTFDSPRLTRHSLNILLSRLVRASP